MSDAVDAVLAAVRALNASHDANERARANDYLVQLDRSPDAVHVALDVLERARADERACFFAANVVASALTRTRSVEALERARGAFRAVAADASGEQSARRLALGIASASALSGTEEVGRCKRLAESVATTSGIDASGMRVGIELLALLAEKCDEESGIRRRNLARACANECDGVLRMVGEVFTACGSARTRERDALRASCVRATRGWLKLDPSGDVVGGLRVSPTEFATNYGALFENILQCLVVDRSGCGEAAVDMLVELHQGRSGTEAEEFQAVNAVTRGLLAHGATAMESEDSLVARNISLVAVALSERCVNVLCRGDDASLALVSLILSLMDRHGREVTEVAVDFFLMMDTVASSMKHESLRAPMHVRMVEVIVKQATLPDDFTCWEEAAEDEETFERFREHILADLLDNAYGVLRGQYFHIVAGALGAAKSWRDAEAGAFALRAIAARVMDDLEESATPEIETFLTQLLSTVAEHATDNSGLFSSHALVRASSCRLIESYASWLGRRSSATDSATRATLARSVLTYITSSFPHPIAWPRAATAFRSVCSRCSRYLNDASTFAALLSHSEQCIASIRVTFDRADTEDHRPAAMEGLARLVSSMPIQQASEASGQLIAPVIARLKSLAVDLAGQIPPNQMAHAEASRAVAAELGLIASSIRFLEFTPKSLEGSRSEHPAISVLAAAWTTMEDLVMTRTWQAPVVVKAIGEIYVATLLSAKSKSENMIVPMLESIARTFMVTRHPCLFEPVSTAIEMASTSSSENGESGLSPNAPQVASALVTAFVRMASETVRCASSEPSSPETWERAEALFGAARAFVMFAPAHGLANEALFPVLDLAGAALELREYGPVRASLALLNALANPGEKSKASAPWVANASRVDEFFVSRGSTLVRTILHAACSETMPRTALRAAATLIATLAHSAPDVVVGWIVATISSSPPTPFSAHARDPFVAILARRPLLDRHRLVSAICDYVLISLGIGDVDDLLAYSM